MDMLAPGMRPCLTWGPRVMVDDTLSSRSLFSCLYLASEVFFAWADEDTSGSVHRDSQAGKQATACGRRPRL